MDSIIFLKTGNKFKVSIVDCEPQNWDNANLNATELGQGWRLPKIDELEAIYEQLHKTGKITFPVTTYWSSSEFSDDVAWYFDFAKGMDGTAIKKLAARIIAVKETDENPVEEIINKIIVFGDIHGYYKAAETASTLAKEIGARAIFLGDYIDRGPSSIKIIQLMIDTKRNNPDWVFLRGNHEKMLLDLIEECAQPNDDIFVLEDTESSYSQAADTFNTLQNLDLVEQKNIIEFLNNTQLFFELEDWIFVHAVIRNTNESLFQKSQDELIWNYKHDPLWDGKKFIHGHLLTQDNNLEIRGKGTNINTRCGYGGVLTGLLIDCSNNQQTIYRISESGEIIK